MDLSNSETTPSDKLMKYYSNNAPFRSTYHRQAFYFRDTLIRYITNNPASSKSYQKMIQSCKHFFIKNSIVIVPELYFVQKEGWYTQVPSKDRPNGRSVYLNEITSKIWNTDSMDVWGTVEELLEIPHFLSLDEFRIWRIPEIFDIISFYGHIKKNKKTWIDLNFFRQISDEYKTRIQTIVDEILETEDRVYKIPSIYFSEITHSSRERMYALYS
uniref:Uncharacterized protein n=1 Tax=Panagrolaimus davidi TaxID=227884 RepID=A0A914PQA6_9BILA